MECKVFHCWQCVHSGNVQNHSIYWTITSVSYSMSYIHSLAPVKQPTGVYSSHKQQETVSKSQLLCSGHQGEVTWQLFRWYKWAIGTTEDAVSGSEKRQTCHCNTEKQVCQHPLHYQPRVSNMSAIWLHGLKFSNRCWFYKRKRLWVWKHRGLSGLLGCLWASSNSCT